MPNWQPNWADVRWDWGASDAAGAALRRMADLLDGTAHEREQAARQAQAEWRGVYRDRFDTELAQMLSRAHGLANDCRDAAGRVARAAQQAYAEQQHREQERERWRREKAEEDRRRKEGERRKKR